MAHPNNSCYRIFYHESKLKIWGIEEAYYVNIYLIEGDDKALVIDTGRGIGNLHEFIRTLTDKPVIVVNTHKHFDHTGGNGTFEEVYMLDEEIESSQPEYRVSESKIKKVICERLYWNDKRPYNFSPDYMTVWPGVPIIPIRDGFVFELGNRPIEVIHTNGHTKGSVCLLDRMSRILFVGDTANAGVLIIKGSGQSISKHKESMVNLLGRSGEYDLLFLGHGVDSEGINQIEEIIAAEQDILDGTAVSRPNDTSWPCSLLYTKGRITVGYDIESVT